MDDLTRGPNETIGLSSPLTQADNGRVERLRAAHAEAVAEIERIRNQPGQLTTGINEQVGSSILEAGVLALASVRHVGSSCNTKEAAYCVRRPNWRRARCVVCKKLVASAPQRRRRALLSPQQTLPVQADEAVFCLH